MPDALWTLAWPLGRSRRKEKRYRVRAEQARGLDHEGFAGVLLEQAERERWYQGTLERIAEREGIPRAELEYAARCCEGMGSRW